VVDALRGLACVAMIAWHTAECWIGPPVRDGWGFGKVRLVGGFAAPLFLWLAGLSLALSTELRPSWERTAAGLVRAGWVVAVGYALKLFAWTVDHGAVLDARNLTTVALAVPGVMALLFATREPPLGPPRSRAAAGALGAITLVIAYSGLEGTTRHSDVLARLDVLHGIGGALGALGLVLFALGPLVGTERARALALGALAVAVALATPRWVDAPTGPVPPRVMDWIARTVADPAASGARFPLFPWLGHALVGAAVGTLLRRAPPTLGRDEVPFVRRPVVLVAATLAVMALVFEGGPVAPLVTERAEWARPVLRLAFYGSAALGAAGALSYVGRGARPLYEALATLGRSSLLVYGAHLELVYGLLGIPLRRTLGWPGWVAAAVAVLGLMVVASRGLEGWERTRATAARRAPQAPPGADLQ
jgi:uncharacterized membrane protein